MILNSSQGYVSFALPPADKTAIEGLLRKAGQDAPRQCADFARRFTYDQHQEYLSMNWGGRVRRLRRTEFVRTLGASLLDLLDEALAFIGFFVALFTGLYFSCWWVFGGVLGASFLLSVLLRRVLSRKSGLPPVQ